MSLHPRLFAKLSESFSSGVLICFLVAPTVCTGCVIQRYEPATGTEKLWGFGYMKMRVSPVNEGLRVRATQVDALGASLALGKENYGLSAGYERQQMVTVGTNALVALEWYKRDLFGARAGTNFPPATLINTNKP